MMMADFLKSTLPVNLMRNLDSWVSPRWAQRLEFLFPERRDNSDQGQENRFVLELLFGMATFFLCFYGLVSWGNGFIGYGLGLCGFGLLNLGVLIAHKTVRFEYAHKAFIVFSFTLLYLVLLATGGEQNTGILWCFAYPSMVFTFGGLRTGAAYLLVIFVASLILLFVPDHGLASHSYPDNLKGRFVGSLFFVSLMSFVLERGRIRAMNQLFDLKEKMEKAAQTDELTNLFNRRGINRKIEYELMRARRDGSELSVMLCDVDHFKSINDSYGHDVGDAALKFVADQLRNELRQTDYAGRWGGEEFILLYPNTSARDAFQIAERIRSRLAQCHLVVNGIDLQLSISSGISSSRFFDDYEALIKAVDVSLYSAKENGRNRTEPSLLSNAQQVLI